MICHEYRGLSWKLLLYHHINFGTTFLLFSFSLLFLLLYLQVFLFIVQINYRLRESATDVLHGVAVHDSMGSLTLCLYRPVILPSSSPLVIPLSTNNRLPCVISARGNHNFDPSYSCLASSLCSAIFFPEK